MSGCQERNYMRTTTLLAITLITLGIGIVGYQTISHMNKDKIVDSESLTVTTAKTRTIPLPSIIGAVSLVGGLLLLAKKVPAGRFE